MTLKGRLFQASHAQLLMVSFLLAMTAAILLGLGQSLKKAQESLRPRLQVSLFLNPAISDDDAAKVGAQAQTLDREIQSLSYVSKADAYQSALKDPTLSKSLMVLKSNPFPPVYIARYSDRAWTDRTEPGELLHSITAIQEIRWDPQARSLFRSLQQWRLWLVRLDATAAALLALWAFIGLYRFIALRSPLRALIVELAIGAFGGALAAGLWWFALYKLGQDARVFEPQAISWLPLATGAVVGLAFFGSIFHEN